jgi:hypothetical protein
MHQQVQQLRFLNTPRGMYYTLKFEEDMNLRHIVASVEGEDPPSQLGEETGRESLNRLIGLGQWPKDAPPIDPDIETLGTREGIRLIAESHGISQVTEGYLYYIQKSTLEQADPVYISADVTDMIDYARESFDPEPVLPTDPFTFCGFAWLPRPIALDDHPTHDGEWVVYVRAISWIPIHGEDPDKGCFWVTFYVHADDDMKLPNGRGLDTRTAFGPLAELTCVHTFQWTWGTNPWPDFEGEARIRAKAQVALVQSMWRLGSQVMHAKQRLPRAYRRDAKRHGVKAAEDVTVITLRREGERHYDEEGESPEWKHKWLVRGHWRRQWYPSIKEHRQVWIAPYVKGPEHLPLKLTKRVFEFTR